MAKAPWSTRDPTKMVHIRAQRAGPVSERLRKTQNSVRRIGRSLLDFLLPTSCLHCHCGLTPQERYFCRDCAELFELIDPTHRCRHCFSGDRLVGPRLCRTCSKARQTFTGAATCFDPIGPPLDLVHTLKRQPVLAMGAAAFMVAQWVRLGWPLPDLVVPVPMCRLRYLWRGFNQAALLAKGVARLLSSQARGVLRYAGTGFAQSALSTAERAELDPNTVSIKKRPHISDRTLLLIDDCAVTGATLEACGRALWEGFPSAIYALTLTRRYHRG